MQPKGAHKSPVQGLDSRETGHSRRRTVPKQALLQQAKHEGLSSPALCQASDPGETSALMDAVQLDSTGGVQVTECLAAADTAQTSLSIADRTTQHVQEGGDDDSSAAYSQQDYMEAADMCYHVSDKLFAIHVSSELTDSHFDM